MSYSPGDVGGGNQEFSCRGKEKRLIIPLLEKELKGNDLCVCVGGGM